MSAHKIEVEHGQRFAFGQNWQRYLTVVNEPRIIDAEKSLKAMLQVKNLQGKSFLDIGSGSGLFSLAAMRLGAKSVYSFDYDTQSVGCTQELRQRYFPQAENWVVEPGSVLNGDYLNHLGQWDIVYSWGVLHHTGNMWQALDNVAPLVKKSGVLFISIYNDQGVQSKFWKQIKFYYNRNVAVRWAITALFIPFFFLGSLAADLIRLRNPLQRYTNAERGMSAFYDWIDWLGGYPFEVAKPEQVFEFYRNRGFVLQGLKTCGGKLGCNEFIFEKS